MRFYKTVYFFISLIYFNQLNLTQASQESNVEEQDFLDDQVNYQKTEAQKPYFSTRRLKIRFENNEILQPDELKHLFDYYTEKSEAGDGDAKISLAAIYCDGIEGRLERDAIKAFELYKKASTSNLGVVKVIAWLNLAHCYYNGEGTSRNPKQAFYFFDKASKNNNSDAQAFCAHIYSDKALSQECEIEQDDIKAFNLSKQAAEKDNALAQYLLGNFFLEGRGVEQDSYKAYKWYIKATAQGDQKAKTKLEALEQDSDSESESEYSYDEVEDVGCSVPDNIVSKLAKLNEELKLNKKINFKKYSEFYIPLYRGVHYLPELFETRW